MQKNFPKNLEDIESFYKQSFEGKGLTPSEGMFESVMNGLGNIPTVSPDPSSLVTTAASKSGLAILSVKSVIILVSTSASIVLAIYFGKPFFDPNFKSEKPETSKTVIPVVSDTIVKENIVTTDVSASTQKVNVSENETVVPEVIEKKENNTSTTPSEKIYEDIPHKDVSIIDSSAIEDHNPVEKDEPLKPEEIKKEEKENFFSRKLKQQKDSSGKIFKPKQ